MLREAVERALQQAGQPGPGGAALRRPAGIQRRIVHRQCHRLGQPSRGVRISGQPQQCRPTVAARLDGDAKHAGVPLVGAHIEHLQPAAVACRRDQPGHERGLVLVADGVGQDAGQPLLELCRRGVVHLLEQLPGDAARGVVRQRRGGIGGGQGGAGERQQGRGAATGGESPADRARTVGRGAVGVHASSLSCRHRAGSWLGCSGCAVWIQALPGNGGTRAGTGRVAPPVRGRSRLRARTAGGLPRVRPANGARQWQGRISRGCPAGPAPFPSRSRWRCRSRHRRGA